MPYRWEEKLITNSVWESAWLPVYPFSDDSSGA
jgi:hypothetical protein